MCFVLIACDPAEVPSDAGVDGGVDAGGPRDWPASEVPSVTEPETGIRREVSILDGVAAPPNPDTMDPTPPDQNRFGVVRFSAADEPDVRATTTSRSAT